jgi:hypothetical protein
MLLDNKPLRHLLPYLEARQPDYGDLNMLIANALPEPRARFVFPGQLSAISAS